MLKNYKIVMIITILLILTSCNNSSIPVLDNQIIVLEEKIEEQSKENKLLQVKYESLEQENNKLKDEVKLLKYEPNDMEDKPKENSIKPELQILKVSNNNKKNIIRYIFEEHDGAHQITNIIGYENDGLVGSNEFEDINIDGTGGNYEIYKIKVIGSLFNFELVEVKMDENSNFYENRVIYSADEIKNKNIYINTVIPEGVPIEKIKWTDKDGKLYEYYLGFDGFGFSGEILWSDSGKIEQLNTEIKDLKEQLSEKDEVINRYEYERDLYDTYDIVPIQFLRALETKNTDAMNELLSDNMEIKIVDNKIGVYSENKQLANLGNLSYNLTGYTIHGFTYNINEKMLVVYTQVFYENDNEIITPPTYIDIGFRIDEDINYPLLIDWISRDV